MDLICIMERWLEGLGVGVQRIVALDQNPGAWEVEGRYGITEMKPREDDRSRGWIRTFLSEEGSRQFRLAWRGHGRGLEVSNRVGMCSPK